MDPQFQLEPEKEKLTDALPWKPDGGSFLRLQSRCHGNQRINPEAIVPDRVSLGLRPECENYMPKERLTSRSRLGLGRLVMLPVSNPTVWCLLGCGRFRVWLPRGRTSLMWPESLSHSAARFDRLDGARDKRSERLKSHWNKYRTHTTSENK
ncbi:uncharacterized protein NPIL_235691 [Nephila pilipes]|uniref:Uncharacterized protein n=1 Tax=Nephila pilipes TaxID=299642 RepID=A0A8X6MMJ3_NEPPI|nr:uncharacterized protein NPIL_235691 [Nephila pilipes]